MFLIDDMVNAWSTERTNEQAAINAKQQRDWQEKMWHMNNEYNDPLSQKSRLEAAGINPYSVMAGEGSDVGNSSSPPSSVPPAPVQPYTMSNGIGLDILQAMKLAKETEGQDIANESAKVNLAFQETEKYLGIRETQVRIRKLLSSRDVDDANKDYLRLQYNLLEAQATSILKKSRAEASQAETVSQNLQRQYDDQHFESVSKRILTNAQVRVSNATYAQIGQAINESIQRVENLKAEKELTEKQIKTEIANEAEKIINTYINWHSAHRDDKKIKSEIATEMWRVVMESSEIKLPFGSIRPPHPATQWFDIKQNKSSLDWLDEDW